MIRIVVAALLLVPTQAWAQAENRPAPSPVYFGDNPIFQIFVDGAEVLLDQVMVCDISDISATDWRRPLATKSYTPTAQSFS